MTINLKIMMLKSENSSLKEEIKMLRRLKDGRVKELEQLLDAARAQCNQLREDYYALRFHLAEIAREPNSDFRGRLLALAEEHGAPNAVVPPRPSLSKNSN